MTRTYIVTEGESDKQLLTRVLPPELMQDVVIAAGSGYYSAHTLASSLLATRQKPVALVVDADTTNESLIQERCAFLHSQLRRFAIGIPYGIFLAVPQLETIFFYDRVALETDVHRGLTEEEWSRAKYEPKHMLEEILNGRGNGVAANALAELWLPHVVEAARQHPLIQELCGFLTLIRLEQPTFA